MANPLKTAAIRLRDAISCKASEEAEAALLAGMRLGSTAFIGEARKESVFRFARYDFDAPLLLQMVAKARKYGAKSLDAKSDEYLKSVEAFGVLAPVVYASYENIKSRLSPRSFKSYLVAVEKLFRAEHRQQRSFGRDHILRYWQSFPKEDLADAFSYYYCLLAAKAEPTVHELNTLSTKNLSTGYYLDQLTDLARIISFREVELVVQHFPYRAVLQCNYVVVEPLDEAFEKGIRWSYIRQEDQRNADRHHFESEESLPSGERPGALRTLAKLIVDNAADMFFEPVSIPVPRIRMHLPMAKEFTKIFSDQSAPTEEVIALREASKSFFVSYEELRSIRIFKSLTLHEVIRFQRLCIFGFLALEEYCRQKGLLNTDVYHRSLIPHFTESQAFSLIREVCGIGSPEDMLELLTANPIKGIVDLLYTPILKVAGQYLIPFGIVANSNIVRNALIKSRFRFDAEDTSDPLSDFLVKAFSKASVKAVPRVKYSHQGIEGEVDVLAVIENRLFVFECKNSLHPCNPHELRQSYDYVRKGFEQLTRFRELLAEPDFCELIASKTGLDLRSTQSACTCVVTGNRMFSGLRERGHTVRNVNDLVNTITGGNALLYDPREGPNPKLKIRRWRGSHFSGADLAEFIENDCLQEIAFSAMADHNEIVPFGHNRLRIKSFVVDLDEFLKKASIHPACRDFKDPDSADAKPGV